MGALAVSQALFELGPGFECPLARRTSGLKVATSNVSDACWTTKAGPTKAASLLTVHILRFPARHDARPAEVRCKARQRSSADLAAAIPATWTWDARAPCPNRSTDLSAGWYRLRHCEFRSAYPK